MKFQWLNNPHSKEKHITRKFIAFATILVMACTIFTACGGSSPSSPQTNSYSFVISGKVVDTNANGIANVSIAVQQAGGNTVNTTTSSQAGIALGAYFFNCLPGTYTLRQVWQAVPSLQ
jgi:hypothetical protein